MGLLLGTLAFGRKQAIARMTETVTVYDVTATTPDPVTFLNVETRVTKYAGVARVVYENPVVREREQATQSVAYQEPRIDFPTGTVIQKDWFVTVTASTSDAALIGRMFRTRGFGTAGQTTALRVPVAEVS